MGVRGLASYMRKNSNQFLKDFQLSDSTIVVDGNRIIFQLYYTHYPCSNDCFGGDYDTYAEVVKNFFRLLSECNVKPIILFDGGCDERKLELIKERENRSINLARLSKPSTLGRIKAFPLFMIQVFVDVVRKLDIQYACCDFEADQEIAALALKWNCPVLSHDSDFFIYGTKYIPFDTVCMDRMGESSDFYIRCKIYDVVNLIHAHPGLTKEHLPLLATLLGNDKLNKQHFQPFQTALCGSATAKNQHNFIDQLLAWLSATTTETAIKKVLSYIDDVAQRKSVEQIINTSVTNFLITETVLYAYFTTTTATCDDFELRIRRCEYPRCFMNIRHLRLHFQHQLVQDMRQISAHYASIEVLRRLCALVRPSINENNTDYVYVYDRTGDACFSGRRLKYTSEISGQLQMRLEQVIHFKNWGRWLHRERWIDSWLVFSITLKYWLDIVDPPIFCVTAVVMCAIVLNVVYKQTGVCKDVTEINRKLTCSFPKNDEKSVWDIDLVTCWRTLKELHRYFSVNTNGRQTKEKKHTYDYKAVHMLAQFQSCLMYINYMNCMLENAYPHCEVASFFNGTFIHNVAMNLKQHQNGRLFSHVKQMLTKSSTTYELLVHILTELGIQNSQE